MDTESWLNSIGLGKYAEAFEQNGIDADLLLDLTNDDLKDLGVDRLADRKRILKAIQQLEHGSKVHFPDPRTVSIPEGEYRHVAVLFADLAGYTELTSRVGAEGTHSVLNRYFDLTDSIVKSYGGTVDKHIGDNVMAVFGAPVGHDDDPLRAINAAIDIQRGMGALSEKTGLDLSAHIGIAAGKVVASGTGSSTHREYTVTGDAVNLAARLQNQAKSGQTLVSDAVRSSVGERAKFEDRGKIVFKGIDQPAKIWRLISLNRFEAAGRTAFIGRRSELAQVSSIISMCAERENGQALSIRGEPGIGKTRLTEEIARIGRDHGFACHKALVLDFGVDKDRETIPSIVRSLLGLTPPCSNTEQAVAVKQAVHNGLIGASQSLHLIDVLGLEVPLDQRATFDAMDNTTRTEGRRDAVCALLGGATKAQPLVLIVEDIHWSASDLLSYLANMAAVAAELPILLVMTSRTEGYPLDAAWSANAGGCAISTIDLGPLRAEEAVEFADVLTEETSSFVGDCIQRAAGNPLFLEQLLHNAREHGGEELPASIQSLVMARLDRLAQLDKAALQAASVLGQRFTLSAVRHLIGDPDYDCRALVGRHLIKPDGNDGYLFVHSLMQEGVYASLLMAKRADIHRDAASWFADTHPELRAEHLDRAEDPGAAEAYLDVANIQAAGHHYDAALRFAGRGLELARNPNTACDLLCLRGDALREIGDTDESIAEFSKALECAEDDFRRCACLIGTAGGLRMADRQSEVFDILRDAEEAAIRADLTAERAKICYLRGNAFFPLGDIDGCLREHQEALQYANVAGSPESEALSLGGLGDAYYLRGHMRTACEQFRRCVAICRQYGLGRIEVANSHMIGWTRLFLMEFQEAHEDGLKSIELAVEVNHRRAECLGHLLAGGAAFCLSLLDETEAHMTRGCELARDLGANNFRAQMLGWLARVSLKRGDTERARALVDEATAVVEKRTGMTFIGPAVYAIRAEMIEDPVARQAALREVEKILDTGCVWHNQIWYSEIAIDTALVDGRWDEAYRVADRLEDLTREEPLEWPDFLIARARALTDWGRGYRGADLRATLSSLIVRAREKRLLHVAGELEEIISTG